MNPWKAFADKRAIDRKVDEQYHAEAFEEYQSGAIRPGLMAKAVAECDGDSNRAKARYIKLLAAAIKDDYYLATRVVEEHAKASRKLNPEYQNERIKAEAEYVKRSLERAQKPNTISKETAYHENAEEKKGSSSTLLHLIILGIFLYAVLQFFAMADESSQHSSTVSPQHSSAASTPIAVSTSAPSRDANGATESTTNQTRSDLDKQPRKSGCIYKPVMSDADYRACGMSPPKG